MGHSLVEWNGGIRVGDASQTFLQLPVCGEHVQTHIHSLTWGRGGDELTVCGSCCGVGMGAAEEGGLRRRAPAGALRDWLGWFVASEPWGLGYWRHHQCGLLVGSR